MTDDKLPPSLSRFGAELQRAIARELGSDQEPQTSSSRRRRPRLIAGTTLAAAAVAAVIVLVVGATTSSPAYAVSQNRDGTVTVRVQQLAAVGGLNERLRTLHVPARVVAVAAACGQLMYREISPSIHANVSATRFDPRAIPHGQTLLLASWLAGHQVQVAIARQVAGRTPACLAHRMARQLAISVHSANNPPIVWTCGFPRAGAGGQRHRRQQRHRQQRYRQQRQQRYRQQRQQRYRKQRQQRHRKQRQQRHRKQRHHEQQRSATYPGTTADSVSATDRPEGDASGPRRGARREQADRDDDRSRVPEPTTRQ